MNEKINKKYIGGIIGISALIMTLIIAIFLATTTFIMPLQKQFSVSPTDLQIEQSCIDNTENSDFNKELLESQSYTCDIDEESAIEIAATKTITVHLIWDDDNNRDGLRPSKAQMQLRKKDTDISYEYELSGNNTENLWQKEIKITEENFNPNEWIITHEVDILTAEEYTFEQKTESNTIIVTEKHNPYKVTFNVNNIWQDNNQTNTRPEKVTFHIYGEDPASELYSGEIYAKDNWVYKAIEKDKNGNIFPRFNKNGQEIEYTIKSEISGTNSDQYQKEYKQEEKDDTIITGRNENDENNDTQKIEDNTAHEIITSPNYSLNDNSKRITLNLQDQNINDQIDITWIANIYYTDKTIEQDVNIDKAPVMELEECNNNIYIFSYNQINNNNYPNVDFIELKPIIKVDYRIIELKEQKVIIRDIYEIEPSCNNSRVIIPFISQAAKRYCTSGYIVGVAYDDDNRVKGRKLGDKNQTFNIIHRLKQSEAQVSGHTTTTSQVVYPTPKDTDNDNTTNNNNENINNNNNDTNNNTNGYVETANYNNTNNSGGNNNNNTISSMGDKGIIGTIIICGAILVIASIFHIKRSRKK